MREIDQSAASLMAGMTLPSGWRVIEKVDLPPGGTGSAFSVGYIVELDGQRAFMKALDYSAAFQSGDTPRALQKLTEAFNFEVDVLAQCASSRMDRVVLALDSGGIDVPGIPGFAARVNYLIFEKADGDIRATMDMQPTLIDCEWSFRTLHHAATGLWQLHGAGIAHQDVKPSNILTFGRVSAKLGDLGSASKRGATSPRDARLCPGDPAYAPPETLYGHEEPDWGKRRQSTDLYLLGSLAVFLFTRVPLSASIISHLDVGEHPNRWAGTYREILPSVRCHVLPS